MGMCLLTAYGGLCSTAKIHLLPVPASVLVIGASGGVGSMAVQISKRVYCASVTGVCSGKNADFVKSLGADSIVDYTQGTLSDLLPTENCFDIIFDTVGGNTSWDLAQRILKPKGVFVTAIGPFADVKEMTVYGALKAAGSILWKKVTGRRSYSLIMNPPALWPPEVLKWIQDGAIKPVTQHVFDLKDVEEAHKLSRSNRATGKIVLKIR